MIPEFDQPKPRRRYNSSGEVIYRPAGTHQVVRRDDGARRAIGYEGRGIGLVKKLRAYVAQDDGADRVEANTGRTI